MVLGLFFFSLFASAMSLQVGKLADLVIWNPAFFGAKPEMVIKGGDIAWANMGDPNASIPTPEPVRFDNTSLKLHYLIDCSYSVNLLEILFIFKSGLCVCL